MTTSRFLPILNLVGCLLITGIVLAQWLKERGLDRKIDTLGKELVVSREETAEARKRATALESDVSQLKASIEETMKARQEAEAAVEKITAEHNTQMETVATASGEQVKTWEAALAARDEKIRELGAALSASRERLNEAVAKLKEAGAR